MSSYHEQGYYSSKRPIDRKVFLCDAGNCRAWAISDTSVELELPFGNRALLEGYFCERHSKGAATGLIEQSLLS